MKQTESGKAFEYCLAVDFAECLPVPFIDSAEKQTGLKCFGSCDAGEQDKIRRAAREAAIFLINHDAQFKQAVSVTLQPDKVGRQGDVRDLLFKLKTGGDIGISSKNRHDAVKHSRLSDKIDFGREWADCPCSPRYMKSIDSILGGLRTERERGTQFRDIPDKANRYYLPTLAAFEDELRNLCDNFGQRFTVRMFQYLLGKQDFYKVMKENGHVAIQSFNIEGRLQWGKKWKIPDRIETISRKRGSNNTLIISFVGGWQFSFRIHSADKIATPSLKFDIRFIGLPQNVIRHEIDYL
ncbi:MAG: HaeIII family restriction endonuclease [Bacteroidales bacterium]